MAASTLQVHGTAVALDDVACLLTGAPGTGKSTIALEMIALGASLVSDDRVDIAQAEGVLVASAPATISGLIEARGLGLLRLTPSPTARLVLLVDLDTPATNRLPSAAFRDLLGIPVPVINGRERQGLAALLAVTLRAGGPIDPDHPATR